MLHIQGVSELLVQTFRNSITRPTEVFVGHRQIFCQKYRVFIPSRTNNTFKSAEMKIIKTQVIKLEIFFSIIYYHMLTYGMTLSTISA